MYFEPCSARLPPSLCTRYVITVFQGKLMLCKAVQISFSDTENFLPPRKQQINPSKSRHALESFTKCYNSINCLKYRILLFGLMNEKKQMKRYIVEYDFLLNYLHT